MSMNDVAFLHHGQPPRQPVARPKSPRRHTRISGQSLAKAERDPRELAHLAAGWLLGSVTIEPPTVALAARVFGVSGTLIGEATDEIEARLSQSQPSSRCGWNCSGSNVRNSSATTSPKFGASSNRSPPEQPTAPVANDRRQSFL